MSRFVLPAATALAAALLLGACSKSAPTASAPAGSQPSLSNALSPAAVEQAAKASKASNLPQPDFSTPDSAYVDLTKGNQVMFLNAAFSGLPANYDRMAQAYSNDYRSTSDAFKKHDLLTALQPKMDAAIADAKAHPYITWTDDSPQIGHYDFTQHTFADGSALFQQGGYVSFFDNGGYNLAVTNGPAFQQLHVADETKARAIEELVGKVQSLRVRIYAFVQSTDDSGAPTVEAMITKVQLLDSHGQVLLEQSAPR
jgi:hypothetical protein